MKPGLGDLSATLVDGEVRTSVPPTLPPATEKEKDKEKIEEEEDEVVEEASSKKPRAFNFASHDAGAIVLDKPGALRGSTIF